MLKENNDAQLIENGVNEIIIPFYQIWQELVNVKTLDIYQYRILTSLSALKELSIVISKTLKGIFTNDANIDSCREETLYIINNDDILNKYCKGILNRLKFCLGNKPKCDADKNRVLAHVNYAIKEIQPLYEKWYLSELKDAIIHQDMKKIIDASNVVASQAASNGWSAYALTELLRFFRSDKNFEEQWQLFETTLLNTDKQDHDVLIFIPFRNQRNGVESDTIETLSNLGLEILGYERLIEEYDDLDDIQSLLNAQKRYFRVRVKAYDVYSAANIAIRRISDQLNMASFYNLVSAWDLSSVTIVVINRINKYHKQLLAGQLYKTYDYLESSGRVFSHTKDIFADETKKELREKLTGAFGYANISRASLFQEEKYMNLWVALESLARTRMYPDIISNVKQTVPAAMSLRYIYRIVRNYIEDCVRCRVEFKFTNFEIDMKQDTKQKLVEETISIFLTPHLYAELLEKCKVNSLLYFRTKTVYDILSDAKELKKKVKNHHDRVEWQIQRLYRVRNEIVHAALQNETSLVPYIEHLYDYLATYITEIVSCICVCKEGTIEEALAHIKDNYDVFIAFSEQGELDIINATVVKTGIIDLVSVSKGEDDCR